MFDLNSAGAWLFYLDFLDAVYPDFFFPDDATNESGFQGGFAEVVDGDLLGFTIVQRDDDGFAF